MFISHYQHNDTVVVLYTDHDQQNTFILMDYISVVSKLRVISLVK